MKTATGLNIITIGVTISACLLPNLASADGLRATRRQVLVGTAGAAAAANLPPGSAASGGPTAFVGASRADFWMAENGLRGSVEFIRYKEKLASGAQVLQEIAQKLVTLEENLAAKFNVPLEAARENLRLLVSEEAFLNCFDAASRRPFFPRRYQRLGGEFEEFAIKELETIHPQMKTAALSNRSLTNGRRYENEELFETRESLGQQGQRQIFWFDDVWMRACMFDEVRKVDQIRAGQALWMARDLYFKKEFIARPEEKDWTFDMRLAIVMQISAKAQDDVRMAPAKAIADMEFALAREWNISIDQIAEWVEGWRKPTPDLIWHQHYVRREFPRPEAKHQAEYLQRLDQVLPLLAHFFRTEPQRRDRYEQVDWKFMTPEKMTSLKMDVRLHRSQDMMERIELFEKTGEAPPTQAEVKTKLYGVQQASTPTPAVGPSWIVQGLAQAGQWTGRALRRATEAGYRLATQKPKVTTECDVKLLPAPNPADAPMTMDLVEEAEPVPELKPLLRQ